MVREMRSQSSVLAHSTKTLNSLTLSNNKGHHRPTTPIGPHHSAQKKQFNQMTTGGGINNGNNNTTSGTTASQQSPSALPLCNTIPSTSSIHTLSKTSTISSTIRHSNVSLSSNNNNNSTTAINNNKLSKNNNNNNGGNSNPNSNKLQTLEQRKLELEKLLNEKNWLLQQIHKQETQILNGNYENFNLLESGKGSGIIVSTGGTITTASGTTNSILRRKGSSSLKLPKTNVHFNGKNNRFTLSKSEYDLAQENKLNIQETIANPNVLSIKKRQGQPLKTNSFHDSTSASALSLTKSPSFEYNESSPQSAGSSVVVGSGGSSNHGIKYGIVRPHHSSNENLSNILGITQCDKYYLSPTSQMYADGTGFIKASQNIKQCLSPAPMAQMISLNDIEIHRTQQQEQQQQQQQHQQQQQMANGHNLIHHNGSQPQLEQYESVDALSLSPSNSFDKTQNFAGQHSNLWRALSNNDRSAWCDKSYIELDRESVVNQYHSLNPLAKKILPTTSLSGSSLQHLSESPSLGNFYPIGGIIVGSYPNTIEKSCDEVSISSLNSETSKKPKNKQWMESSLDGPIIRPNILQSTPSVTDTIALRPALSPTLSQNPQYAYYNAPRQATASNAVTPSGKLTPSPAKPSVVGGGSSVPVVNSRPPTRTLTHHSHPHHKQTYRERTKLSSQSMSSGSYRTPKTKIDDENSHLSHSTSYLNVDPYHHPHFPQQQLTHQTYHHNHFHLEIPNSSNGSVMMPPLQQQQKQLQQLHQQKSPKSSPTSSTTMSQQQSPLPKFSPTIQQPQQSSISVNDDFVGTIRYATSMATQPSRLCSLSQTITKNTMQQKPTPPNSLSINTVQQMSPQSTTSPDIRIESPKNITVVQQATFLPYKEVTKPFEMSDFYKYSTKFRQKEANTATISKNST